MNKVLLSSLCAVVAVVGMARAQTPPAKKTIFVSDLVAPPDLGADATALTSSLCGLIAKDKTVDVLCAPDVRQILGFAAMSSATGGVSPTVEKLQARLESVDFVVAGKVQTRQKELALVVGIGPRADGADAASPYAESSLTSVEVVGPGAGKLLDQLPDVTRRLLTPLKSPLPPPAPLAPAPTPAPAH
jgi:hypothetical protein